MKNEIIIPIPKEEDKVELNRRREDYAHARDIQALEYNEAIAKRLLQNAKNQFRCEKCGKEFTDEISAEETHTCPECK